MDLLQQKSKGNPHPSLTELSEQVKQQSNAIEKLKEELEGERKKNEESQSETRRERDELREEREDLRSKVDNAHLKIIELKTEVRGIRVDCSQNQEFRDAIALLR